MTEITKEKALSHGPTETASIKEPWRKLAHIVSAISNPLFVALPTFLVIAVATSPDLSHACSGGRLR